MRISSHEVPFARVVYPDDPERILHLAANGAAHVADRMDAYQTRGQGSRLAAVVAAFRLPQETIGARIGRRSGGMLPC